MESVEKYTLAADGFETMDMAAGPSKRKKVVSDTSDSEGSQSSDLAVTVRTSLDSSYMY